MEEERDKLAERVERFEPVMLFIAFVAVIIYMADLIGFWASLGIQSKYNWVSFGIDLIFVINLLAKIVLLRTTYLNSPWFIVDFISTLPILSSLTNFPGYLSALRFVRGFRLFRVLRVLRMLNAIPFLKLTATTTHITKEITALKYAIWVIVPIFTFTFLLLISWLYHYSLTQAPILEFYLILGMLAGLLLSLSIVHYQIPAIISVYMHKLLNIALPSQVANYFINNPSAYAHTVKMPATITFCDIKNFTTAVEHISNDFAGLKYNLELVMTIVTDIQSKYDLIIDKFIGDAIMSFRGGDLVEGTAENHAWCVVTAALKSRKAILALQNPYFRDIRVGGASAESALIGVFGTSSRVSYTILGDRVNLAARLESAVKQCQTENLFCDRTYALLKDCSDFVWRRFGKITVEGKSELLDIYEVFESNDISDSKWIEQYHLALADFESRKFSEALEGFMRASDLRPGGDKPSMVFSNYCRELISTPPGSDWQANIRLFK